MTEYFDVDHLIKAKEADMFFCYTHCGDLSKEKQSPDPRYCQDCYDFLLKEWQLMRSVRWRMGKPEWVPVGRFSNLRAIDSHSSGCKDIPTIQSDVVSLSVTKNCEFCGNHFTPERATARYCSDKCRVYASRGKQLSILEVANA